MTAPTEIQQEVMQETPEETLARRNKFQRMAGLPELTSIVTIVTTSRNTNPEIVYLTKPYVPQDVAPQISYQWLQGEQR